MASSLALAAGVAGVAAGVVLGTLWSVESRVGARLAQRHVETGDVVDLLVGAEQLQAHAVSVDRWKATRVADRGAFVTSA